MRQSGAPDKPWKPLFLLADVLEPEGQNPATLVRQIDPSSAETCLPFTAMFLHNLESNQGILVTGTKFTFQASFPSSRTALKSAAKPVPHCRLSLLALAPQATLWDFFAVFFTHCRVGCVLSCSEEMMNNASFVDLQPGPVGKDFSFLF